MTKDYSPFTPGQPASVEFFIGRAAEIGKLKSRAAAAAGTGRLQVSFLAGERGIGKSSLASFVRFLAERDHQALGIHTFLGGADSVEQMVRRVFDRLLKDGAHQGWLEKVKTFFGNHIREVGIMGVSVEFAPSHDELEQLARGFASALRKLVEQFKGEKKAIFLVLDDINGLAETAAFAHWLKSFVDEVATSREPLPLSLVIVGLEEKRQALIVNQPSLARVFDLAEIRPWSPEETQEFFRASFQKVGVEIDSAALAVLSRYAGGLPVLAHEIGDAVFNVDQDNRIDERDATVGVLMAADIVGRKYLNPRVVSAIRSERYHAIPRKLARVPFEAEFTRADIRKRLTSEEARALNDFLTRMRKLGMIEAVGDKSLGNWRFTNLLHYLYFWLEASRARDSKST